MYYKNHLVGIVEYINIKETNLIQFLYDILSVLQKEQSTIPIIPGFHKQNDGIKITILKNVVVLNNVFGANNLLSKEEQDFFLKTFQEFQNYEEFSKSSFGRMLKKDKL